MDHMKYGTVVYMAIYTHTHTQRHVYMYAYVCLCIHIYKIQARQH